MIDLHIHSNHSDGTYSVKEILQEAEKRQLDMISITDHDTIKAYYELEKINIKDYYSGKLINGCEMKCTYQGTPIEILGYGINIDKFKKSKKLCNLQEKYLNIQKEYLEYIKQVGKKIGLIFNQDIDVDITKMQYACDIFEKELIKYDENIEILEKHNISMKPNFYRAEQCNPNSIFYIDETKSFPTIEEIIEEIHNVNGMTFLAHAYIYPFENTIEIVEDIIKETKIDGIECMYSYFTEEQTESLVKLCEKYKKYMSGGTDFHGANRPDTQMGVGKGNMKIDNKLVKNWIDKIQN